MAKKSELNKRHLDKLRDAEKALKKELAKVIVGQEDVVENIIITMLSSGHALLVGVPGLAKTLLIKSLSEIFDLSFSRIQFTPDLMPSDITGNEIIDENRGKRSFRFVKGPIFANIVLADEINRTPPKTQSALLQSMQEYEITASGKTYKLDRPFFVLATQNPIEQEGTYPLPEAQLDRFMFSIFLNYPEYEDEVKIIELTTSPGTVKLKKVLSGKDILELQSIIPQIPVSRHIIEYTATLTRATRPSKDNFDFINDWVLWGAGPRAGQYMIRGAKARAIIHGKNAVDRDDINAVAPQVLRHRVITNFNAESEGITADKVIERLIKEL